MKTQYLTYLLLVTFFYAAARAQSADSLAAPVFYAEDSSTTRIHRLSINSDYADLSPQRVGQELVFVSGRPNDLAVNYRNALNTEVTDLFAAQRKDSVHFSGLRGLQGINSPLNEGPCVFSADGATIWFSANPRKGAGAGPPLQLFTARRDANTGWSQVALAPFCDSATSAFHPALAADGGSLIFASDRAGGYGGTDLYCTRLQQGKWTRPENMGPLVNSAANELFPYLSPEGDLYFSSNRSGGPGGLDLYRLKNWPQGQGAPELLPPPLNSAADDFGVCTEPGGSSGYFTTNRQARHGDDIYFFYSYPDFDAAAFPPVKTKFCYTFFEGDVGGGSDTLHSTFEWDFGAGKKLRGARVRHCYSQAGNYPVQLKITEKNEGLVFENTVSYTLQVEAPLTLQLRCADTAGVGRELRVSAAGSQLKGYELLQYYWDFGDGHYNRGLQARHTFRHAGRFRLRLGVLAKNLKTGQVEKFRVEKNLIVKGVI